MKRINADGLSIWQFESLLPAPAVRHFVTDRRSAINGNEFTLSFSSHPDKDLIRHNRTLVARAMGIAPSHLFFPSQVHLARIVHVTETTVKENLAGTDALVTSTPGLCIAVMSADCVPILLYDRVNGAVAAVHSGWRGTVARILEKTLHKMSETFGTRGEHVQACIGPSVSQESYEVGEEVVTAVDAVFGHHSGLLARQTNNKARLDLWNANVLQLREFGVNDAAIEVANLCTVKNNDYFFSARKGDRGRFAAGIMLASTDQGSQSGSTFTMTSL